MFSEGSGERSRGGSEFGDEGGAHSAFESALCGFVFCLDLFGGFPFVGIFRWLWGDGRFWGDLGG